MSQHEIACKDGVVFLVEDRGGELTLSIAWPDIHLSTSGLLAHVRIPVQAGIAEVVAPPVYHVRTYARRHGGIERADDRALEILKAAAGREGPAPLPFGQWPRLLPRPGAPFPPTYR